MKKEEKKEEVKKSRPKTAAPAAKNAILEKMGKAIKAKGAVKLQNLNLTQDKLKTVKTEKKTIKPAVGEKKMST